MGADRGNAFWPGARIQRHRDATGPLYAVKGIEEGWAVGQDDEDPLAAGQPPLQQGGGTAVQALPQLRIRYMDCPER